MIMLKMFYKKSMWEIIFKFLYNRENGNRLIESPWLKPVEALNQDFNDTHHSSSSLDRVSFLVFSINMGVIYARFMGVAISDVPDRDLGHCFNNFRYFLTCIFGGVLVLFCVLYFYPNKLLLSKKKKTNNNNKKKIVQKTAYIHKHVMEYFLSIGEYVSK